MLKSILMKIAGRLAMLLFVKRKKIDSTGLKTMLVNRADRLGDAIISLPLLLELNKRFDVTVLTSRYNDFILKDFLKTRIFVDNPPSASDFIKKILVSLVSYGYLKRKKNSVPRYDIYLDLIGIRGLGTFLQVWQQNLCRYYIGFNISLWNLLLDHSYKLSVELSGTSVAAAARQLIQESLGIDLDISDHVDLTSKMVHPADFNVMPPYILVNISGFDKFRGPTPEMFARLVNSLEFEGTVVIMDEPDQPNMAEFKRHIQRKNVEYLEKNYSIWELLYVSRGSALYIASNSGITNILQFPAHCVIFFAATGISAWRPFSRNPYRVKKTGRMVVEETTTSAGFTKKIIYSPAWCRPCFDIGCRGYRCIREMDMQAVASEINSFLILPSLKN